MNANQLINANTCRFTLD